MYVCMYVGVIFSASEAALRSGLLRFASKPRDRWCSGALHMLSDREGNEGILSL